MSLYDDIAFITRISGRFRNFKKKSSDTWNFSCPLCGDSTKNTKKARGYIFKGGKERLFYKCYNCNESMGFERFIERVDPSLAREYRLKQFSDSTQTPKTSKPIEPEKEAPKPLFDNSKMGQFFTKIDSLPKNHFAYQYLIQRQIPKAILETELFYTDDFRLAVESILAATGLGLSKETYAKMFAGDKRIIIPFANELGEIIGFQGRSMDPRNPVKYITIKLDPYAPKVYGINRLVKTKTIYVFEGPFDSMFLPNSIAVMDSQLYRVAELVPGIPKENFVLVFDNEPRNKDIVCAMKEAIELRFPIVIFYPNPGPEYEKNKDLNDLVIKGKIPPSVIHQTIDTLTYKNSNEPQRLISLMTLNAWKKI